MSDIIVLANGKLSCTAGEFHCVLGKNGLTDDKKEGDWATPIGEFALRQLFWRPDKLDEPDSKLPKQALTTEDGWCDDPSHEHYNQYIKLPHDGSHENLWRPDDDLYDLIIPIGYNDDPAIPGKGSAIFIHVARQEMTPTAGYIALRKEDLLHILPSLSTESKIRIKI